MIKNEKDTNYSIDTHSRRKSHFITDTLTLSSATVIAWGITIFTAPILTRIFKPEAFGLFGLFTSITSLIGVIICLRYENTIVLPKSESCAANLLALCLIFSLIISLSLIPFIYFFHQPLLSLLNTEGLEPYIWLMPILILISGVFLALSNWNTRTKQFYRLSFARISSSTTSSGTQILVGLYGLATGGTLICANILGNFVSTIVLGGQIWRDDSRLFRKTISCEGIKAGFKRYYRFPLFDTWAALISTFATQLPIYFLAIFFSTTIVGYYSLSTRVLLLPMSFVGWAIAQVFFQRSATALHEGYEKLSLIVEAIVTRLVLIGLFPTLLLCFFSPEIFSIIFGSIWRDAGVITQILALWLFLVFISSPLSVLFGVLEKQSFSLIINIFTFLCRILALIIGGSTGDPLLAIALFSLVGIISEIGASIWIIQKAKGSIRKIIQKCTKCIGYCFIFIFSIFITNYFVNFFPQLILITSSLFGFLYYFLFIKQDTEIKLFINSILRDTLHFNYVIK